MSKFNGHKNWVHWNVSLWINNDEQMYRHAAILCRRYTRLEAAKKMLECLHDWFGVTHTPDGAKYSVSAVRAALVGM